MSDTTQKIKEGKYLFELSEKNGVFYAKQLNTNAKKIWNAQVAYYQFRTAEQRQSWVDQQIARIREYDAWKESKRKARLNAVNKAKVGDILVSSWGYEQTNIDYYQVVAVGKKTVKVREIGYGSIEPTNWMQDNVTPKKDGFIKDAPILTRVVRDYNDGYTVSINECASAWLWDGRPDHRTSYA